MKCVLFGGDNVLLEECKSIDHLQAQHLHVLVHHAHLGNKWLLLSRFEGLYQKLFCQHLILYQHVCELPLALLVWLQPHEKYQ